MEPFVSDQPILFRVNENCIALKQEKVKTSSIHNVSNTAGCDWPSLTIRQKRDQKVCFLKTNKAFFLKKQQLTKTHRRCGCYNTGMNDNQKKQNNQNNGDISLYSF